MPKVKQGDGVVLNNMGLLAIYGTTVGLAHMKSLKMTVIAVGAVSMTAPDETYVVEVDNADINQFMLDDWLFDVIK